ncbi:MAG: hypothetical protein K6F37_05040, partial [Lachnospiraceae bacterium]|nr:hypothetical protein [Lachnospiraceae bacterium]
MTKSDKTENERALGTRLAEMFKCTETMRHNLDALVHYIYIKTEDPESETNKILCVMEAQGLIPCTDKRKSKECLNAFRMLAIGLESEAKPKESTNASGLFSQVYVERDVENHPETKRILSELSNPEYTLIEDCKDVFFEKNQDILSQHENRSLILARQHAKLLYPGAPVCQDFGNSYFYYTSCVKNCIFDCEYCYLKGMYPSANIVIYVDLDRVFEEVKEVLKEHPVYLCVSYDTDLLAMEEFLHYVEKWVNFTKENENLKIEVRTKSANKKALRQLPVCDRVVYAFTISPDEIISKYERKTPSLKNRLKTARVAKDLGHKIRFCFDPMIYVSNWKSIYKGMLDEVWSAFEPEEIEDISAGTFRISASYLKKMRKADPYSEVVWFPYDNKDGYYGYPEA